MENAIEVPEVLEEAIKEVYTEFFELLDAEDNENTYENDIKYFERKKANFEKRIAVTKRAVQLGIPYENFEIITNQISAEVLLIMQEKGVIEDVADKDEQSAGRV